MSLTDWTQPIREEIKQAEIRMAQHVENAKKFRDMTTTLDYIKNYDEYWKYLKLSQSEGHAAYLERYRINALRQDMNFDLGYYDDVYDSHETETKDVSGDE